MGEDGEGGHPQRVPHCVGELIGSAGRATMCSCKLTLSVRADSIAECPHKLPYIATLLGLLANEPLTPPSAPVRVAAKPLVTNTVDGNTVHSGGDTLDTAATDAEMATPTTPATPAAINLGLEIVKDLVKAFQNHLDARRWRSVRFSVCSIWEDLI